MSAPIIDIDALTLKSGGHPSFEAGACLLEAVSYIAGEPWSDHPQCVSPVLGAYGRALNDRLSDDDRQKLKVYIPRLIGTADDGQDQARRWLATDWAIRVATPRWLDLAGLTEHATALRGLAPIVDHATADAARSSARAARDDAWIARRKSRDKIAEAVKAELVKRGFTAVAVADAVAVVAVAVAVAAAVADAVVAVAAADAVADAAADAAAVAAADAVVAAAVAAADAVAVGFSYGSKAYWALREALTERYRKVLGEGEFAVVREVTNREAIELLGKMIDPSAVSA